MGSLEAGTRSHRATRLRAILARASYHLTAAAWVFESLLLPVRSPDFQMTFAFGCLAALTDGRLSHIAERSSRHYLSFCQLLENSPVPRICSIQLL